MLTAEDIARIAQDVWYKHDHDVVWLEIGRAIVAKLDSVCPECLGSKEVRDPFRKEHEDLDEIPCPKCTGKGESVRWKERSLY